MTTGGCPAEAAAVEVAAAGTAAIVGEDVAREIPAETAGSATVAGGEEFPAEAAGTGGEEFPTEAVGTDDKEFSADTAGVGRVGDPSEADDEDVGKVPVEAADEESVTSADKDC